MPSYVPNASDATQPTEDKQAGTAANEFRVIKERLNSIAASIGTGSAATGGVIVPNKVINSTTPNGRIDILDTNPVLWNVLAGSMHLSCDLVFNYYFAANPDGHLAIVLRCDTDVINTAVRGNGAAIGNLIGATNGSPINPAMQLESWANGLGAPMGDNNLIVAAYSGKPLVDNQRYRLLVDSVIMQTTERRLRAALYRWDGTTGEWNLEFDSGYVFDGNQYFDHTKQGLVIGHVFGSNLVPWSIDIQNIRVTWGPAATDLPANIDRISRFGGTFEGNVHIAGNLTVSGTSPGGGGLVEPVTLTQEFTMAGTGKPIRVKNDSLNYNDWTAVQSSQANGATSLLLKPNGTGTATNFIATNNSNLATAFGAVKLAIDSVSAILQTMGVNGAAAPPLDIYVSATRVMALTTYSCTIGVPTVVPSLTIAGAGSTIGSGTGAMTGSYNLNGPLARYFTNASAQDWELNCTYGHLAGLLASSYGFTSTQAQGIENAIMALYATQSVILGELKARKVL